MPELNVKHINKILAHIRADVRRLWMPSWGIRKKDAKRLSRKEYCSVPEDFASCGTACCFAGWSLLLTEPKKDWKKHFEGPDLQVDSMLETERLGLTEGEAELLFHTVYGKPREQSKAVAERLRSIVAERLAKGELSAKKVRV